MKRSLTITVLLLACIVSAQAQVRYDPGAYVRGLRYLTAVQNANGSWGDIPTTSFAVLALLNHGETRKSREFGPTLDKGLGWIHGAAGQSDWEKVCLLHVLSAERYILSNTNKVQQMRTLAASLDAADLSDSQRALLDITRTTNTERQDLSHHLAPFLNEAGVNSPLTFYLTALANFTAGRAQWRSYNTTHLRPISEAQHANGVIRLAGATSETQSTALALLSLSTYYAYWSYYMELGYSPKTVSTHKKDDRTKSSNVTSNTAPSAASEVVQD